MKSLSASNPQSITDTIWNSTSKLELLQLASILDININGNCVPSYSQQFNSPLEYIMGYDIESDRSRIPLSLFGTISETITSIAFYCTCGDKKVFSIIPNVDFDYIHCTDSKDTVSKFLRAVMKHSPQWLIEYNNFGYDNTRIAYHCDEEFDDILIPMRLGSGSSLTYTYYIYIPGTYNTDVLTFMVKTRRHMYPNMMLSTLVKFHTSETKMDFDTADVSDFSKLFEYNIHDCKITVELALKSNMLIEVTSLCAAVCVLVIDSVRFVTDTFAACSIASYCLKHKISMDWSPCLDVKEYRGAEVLTSIVGLHENVISCDFSSMYPTILIGSNISMENITSTQTRASDGSVWKSDRASNFVIQDRLIAFDSLATCIIPPVMKFFVEKRKEVRKSNPSYALVLKIANSIYGSLGDRNSHIYSPMCSASVTTGGRWCLAVAEAILKAYGFTVVYGDTDSCYVKLNSNINCSEKHSIENVLNILKRIFSYTQFPGMSMELESRFSRIAFLGKKIYFGITVDGNIISKSISKSRKDRIGVSRILASNVADILLSNMDIHTMTSVIGDMISIIMDLVIQRKLKFANVSKQVKRGGFNYFEYKSFIGIRELLEIEGYIGNELVGYSVAEVYFFAVKEVYMILVIIFLGNIRSVIR